MIGSKAVLGKAVPGQDRREKTSDTSKYFFSLLGVLGDWLPVTSLSLEILIDYFKVNQEECQTSAKNELLCTEYYCFSYSWHVYIDISKHYVLDDVAVFFFFLYAQEEWSFIGRDFDSFYQNHEQKNCNCFKIQFRESQGLYMENQLCWKSMLENLC